MKTTKAFLYLLVFILQSTVGYSQGKDGGLLATLYPGSVAETNLGTNASLKALLDARSRTFYTKDSMEKVVALYTTSLGGPFEVSSSGDWIHTRSVIPFSEVVDIVTKKGATVGEGGESFWGGTMAGVTLFGKVTNNAFHYSAIKVFEALQGAYLQKVQDPNNPDFTNMAKRLEDPELKRVEDRYEHLKWSYFVQTKEKRKDNAPGNLSMDEVIYDKYFIAPAEARTKELEMVQKKYNDAMAKLNYDEATKLGDRMMELSGIQPDHKKQWDTAIKCLQEMDKHAYATKIVIDMHPSKWDLTPPKN